MIKNLPEMQETWVWFLGQEDPLEKKWQPTPIFLPGELHGQRSLAGYSPRAPRESDTTERLPHTPRLRTHHFRLLLPPSHFSSAWCLVTPSSAAHQDPLSTGFSRQEYWTGSHFLLQGIFPIQGLNSGLLHFRQILYHLSHQGVWEQTKEPH